MSFKKIALLISATALSISAAYAAPNFTQGVAISYGGHFFAQSQPKDASGFKIDYNFMPSNWSWYNGSLVAYMQANYAHWHSTYNYTDTYNTIGVFGVAPIVRWYFIAPMSNIAPYAEASVGAAALSHNKFGDRQLGSRLLFQDMLGVGAAFGQNKQAFASINFLHYSNASLHSENDGITIPVMLTVGYNFS